MGEAQRDIANRGARRDLEVAVNEAIKACDGDLRARRKVEERKGAVARLRAGHGQPIAEKLGSSTCACA